MKATGFGFILIAFLLLYIGASGKYWALEQFMLNLFDIAPEGSAGGAAATTAPPSSARTAIPSVRLPDPLNLPTSRDLLTGLKA